LVWWYWVCELLLHYLMLWVYIATQSWWCPHAAASQKGSLSAVFFFCSVSGKKKNNSLFVARLSLSTMVTPVQYFL
jgi:hypothetical protein